VDTVMLCVNTLIPMINTMRIIKDNMKNAAAKGFINATDCADYLVKKGMPFRDAYKITGTLVALCIDQNKTLETLEISEYKNLSELFEEDVYEAIDLLNCVKLRKVIGGPAPEVVANHISIVKNKLK
ncbi:MAG: argininosuccinate lyase, partial [Erysipelotrichaceae bacterium]